MKVYLIIMKKGHKFIGLSLITTLGIFLMYIIGFPNEMTNLEYLIMSVSIGLIFSGIIIYGDNVKEK